MASSRESQVIVNELLAFIQNAVDTMDTNSIAQICKSSFQEDDICSGKALLFQTLGKEAEMPARRRDGGVKSLKDIITIFQETRRADVPSFVAKQLHRLPPVTFDHVDVTRLLKDVMFLKNSLTEMQTKLEVSNNTIIELRSEVALLRSAMSECRSSDVSNTVARHGARNASVSDAAPADVAQFDASPAADPAPLTPRPADHPSALVVKAGTSRLSTSTPQRAYAEVAAKCPAVSRSKRRSSKGVQNQGALVHKDLLEPAPRESKGDKEGFIKVERKKKPACRNQCGTAPTGPKHLPRTAMPTTQLYVSRLHYSTKAEEIVEYVRVKTGLVLRVAKLESRHTIVDNLYAKETVFYDTFHGTTLTNEAVKQHVKDNTTFWCTIEIEPCDPMEGRRLDGSCNNLQYPSFGAGRTPFIRVLPPHFGKGYEPRPAHSGDPLPMSRRVRTTMLATGVRPDLTFTQLATHFFVFMAADTVTVQDTVNYVLWKPYCCLQKGKSDPMCTPIEVPNDDPVHRFSDIRCLNLTRPITYQHSGCLMNGTTPERTNAATPVFDLSVLYGSAKKNALEKGRLFSGGLLKYEVEDGRVWPPRTRALPNLCLLNAMPHETRCHYTPEDGPNSLIGINIVSIWFWRNHNRIASELSKLNPCWSDEKLFNIARDINIATSVQIYYYEFLPILLGWDNLMKDSVLSPNPGFRDIYNSKVLPQLSLEFPYILRWAHLMQEGRLKMYDQAGNYLKQIPIVNLTLRTGYLAVDDNIDYMTQGSFRQASGKVDYVIDPDMAEVVLGGHQRASDVASNDLVKGRYFGFPSYTKYREYCSKKTFNSFDDLADFIDSDNLDLLKDVYKHLDDIELMAGVWVERPVRGGFAPPTFYCLVVDQLIRSIVSDRHWYERPNRPNAFNLKQLQEIRKATISQLLCDVGDKVTDIQHHGFTRVGPTNKLVNCKDIMKMDLTAWRDDACPKSII